MGKVLLTVIIVLLALFIIYTKDVSNVLKVFLILCLIIAEILVLTVVF